MKKSVEIWFHIFFWIAFVSIILILIQVYLQADPEAPFSRHLSYVIFLELVMGLLFFYITFFGIKWAGARPARIIALVVTLFILLVIFAIPALKIGIVAVMSSVIPHVALVFLALVFRKFSDVQHSEQEKNELLLQKTQGELALLRMQISPHFLFNTLNNIDYLVNLDPGKASDSISKLGAILRYMIYEADAEKIPLSMELKHIRDYIELLRLRVSGPDYLVYKAPAVTRNFIIAPMLFLPLIENAYKYSPFREGDHIIVAELSIEGQMLQFSISNPYTDDLNYEEKGSGVGLQNLRRRLELTYPGRHSLIISKAEQRFIVELKLELDEDKMPGS